MKLEPASLARLLIPDSMLGLQVTACFHVAPRDRTLVPTLTQQMPYPLSYFLSAGRDSLF